MNTTISSIAVSRATSIASGIFLAFLWVLFSIAHFQRYLATGEISLLLLVVAETMGAAFYLSRTDPASVSTRPLDWLIAIVGSFLPFLFRPVDYALVPAGKYFIILGVGMLILGLASLNRSFALVPAKRSIKTRHMYKLVRHPLYASYCVLFFGYLLTNTSLVNAVLYITLIALLVTRIIREESHLMQDEAYRNYVRETKYRLVPFIY